LVLAPGRETAVREYDAVKIIGLSGRQRQKCSGRLPNNPGSRKTALLCRNHVKAARKCSARNKQSARQSPFIRSKAAKARANKATVHLKFRTLKECAM